MSVPGQSSELSVGENPTGVRMSRPLRTQLCVEGGNADTMPEGGRHQAVTQVNVWSPEITNMSEADALHVRGRQHNLCRYWRGRESSLTGSEATAWCQRIEQGTWESPRETHEQRG